MYVVIGWPVALRASNRVKTARSIHRGISFSIPMQAMCSGGREMPISALPSFVHTTMPPVSATAKFTPVIPASAAMNLLRRCPRAASVRYLGSVAPFSVPRCSWNVSPDLRLLDVDRRQHDVTGRLLPQLHDAFAQVGVHDLDAVPLQIRIQVALFGQHRLALDHLADLMPGENVQHDLIVLVRRAGPVHVDAAADRLLLELLQVVGQPSQRVPLDLPGQRAQLFPFGHRVRGLVAFGTDKPEGLIVPVRPFLILR